MELLSPSEPGITNAEKEKRLYNLFRREALFHIRFERIHQFNDGNGRTGRILLNYNLLRENLAPVLITGVMSKDYKRCINDFDVEALTKLFLNSSSQQITNWVSLNKVGMSIDESEISPDNSQLAKLDGYSIKILKK
jgi:fido (protein-threonine AMPylation protein)